MDPSNQMLAQGLAAAEKAIADTPVDATDCKARGNEAYAEGAGTRKPSAGTPRASR